MKDNRFFFPLCEGDSRTLFVKNLPEDATADALREIFDTAADVRLPMKDGYHKG